MFPFFFILLRIRHICDTGGGGGGYGYTTQDWAPNIWFWQLTFESKTLQTQVGGGGFVRIHSLSGCFIFHHVPWFDLNSPLCACLSLTTHASNWFLDGDTSLAIVSSFSHHFFPLERCPLTWLRKDAGRIWLLSGCLSATEDKKAQGSKSNAGKYLVFSLAGNYNQTAASELWRVSYVMYRLRVSSLFGSLFSTTDCDESESWVSGSLLIFFYYFYTA